HPAVLRRPTVQGGPSIDSSPDGLVATGRPPSSPFSGGVRGRNLTCGFATPLPARPGRIHRFGGGTGSAARPPSRRDRTTRGARDERGETAWSGTAGRGPAGAGVQPVAGVVPESSGPGRVPGP